MKATRTEAKKQYEKDIKAARLTKGKSLRGPEPYGCCNTGFAPYIEHSKSWGIVVVGYENDILTVSKEIKDNLRKGKNKRVYHVSGRTVHVFKTTKAGKAKFLERGLERVDDYYNDLEKVKDLKTRASNGDTAAALELNDY